jgi:uncharacterized protein YrrD
MTDLLLRAKSLVGLPVVTINSGEDVAETRDVIYAPDQGHILGFTLNKRGRLAGRMKTVLEFTRVHAVGRDAVMIRDASALDGGEGEAVAAQAKGRNVLGNEVLTDAGKRLGVVVDLVVEMNRAEVIGYELEGDPGLQRAEGAPLLLPLPATLAVSGETLMVPAAVEDYIRDDLAGFGSAVADFRARLGAA